MPRVASRPRQLPGVTRTAGGGWSAPTTRATSLEAARSGWEVARVPAVTVMTEAHPEPASDRLEFRILGPLEVLRDGAPVSRGGQKRRALLARLLLEPNRTVSVDRLVDALWGENVPSSAVKMVHIYVSQLRKVLPSGVLCTRSPGYVLEVAPEAVDLVRFTRLRAEARGAQADGDAATASALLRTALGLWRGPALAEFSEPFARVEAAHIDEVRLAAVEDRVDADLTLGRHDDVVGELRVLVADHPLRQRLCRQLMLALYRAGRHPEALSVYRDFRRRSQDDLGLDVPSALAELEYRILNQDPALDVAAPSPALRAVPDPTPAPPPRVPSPPPRTPPPVGRDAELERLERTLDDAAAGRGSTLLLAGPAGIGKTSLASELADRARDRGATVLTGRCLDLVGAAVPFVPLVEALRPLRASAELEGLSELSRLLGTGSAPPAAAAERHAGEARLHLFEQVLAVLDRLSDAAPVLLVLEDVHWADGSTLDVIAFLAHAVRDRPVVLLASWRVDTLDGDSPVHRLATRLQRAGVAETVELGPLDDRDLEGLLARRSAEPVPSEVLRRACARASGNPFFAQELLAAALRGDEALPRLVRDVLLANCGLVDATSKAVVRVASAVGREAPHQLLAAVLRLPEPTILAALRDAVDHDLLVPVKTTGTYRFRHALVAEAAYSTLLPGEREEVHERLAVALSEHAEPAPGGAPVAAELAQHWLAAGRPFEALTASLRAAREAEAVCGLSEALRHLELVLELWEQVPDAEAITGLAMPTLLAWTAGLVDGAGCSEDPACAGGCGGRTGLGVTEARELYPLALVLESLAIRQSPPFDGAALAALRRTNDRLQAAAHDPSAAGAADHAFHVQLTARCGNAPLLDALRPVKEALLRYEEVDMVEPERIAGSVAQHAEIIAALERRDHGAAAQRLRHNLAGGLPHLTQAIER